MTTTTLPTARPRPLAPRTRPPMLLAVVIAAVVVIGWIIAAALDPPATLERLTIDNPTRYDLEVDLRDSETGNILLLGPVSAGGSKTITEVTDPGARFVVHVTSAGVDGGEATFDRAAVEGADWTITLPPEVIAPIDEHGVTPTTESAG